MVYVSYLLLYFSNTPPLVFLAKPKNFLSKRANRMPDQQAFALVIALILMAFTLLLLLSISALLRVETQVSKQVHAQLKAKNTAQMAVTLALGQLQKTMGPDRRISAQASILSDITSGSVNNVLGTWKSWEGAPQINYLAEKQTRFLGWLCSHPDPAQQSDYNLPQKTVDASAIPLISSGDLNSYAWPVPMNSASPSMQDKNTAYAWLVVGENTKANVSSTSRNHQPGSEAHMLEIQTENTVPSTLDPRILGNDWQLFPTGSASNQRIYNINSLKLLSPSLNEASLQAAEPHLTSHSQGLLIDVQKSGFKQDLNLLLESASLPAHLTNQAIIPGYRKWDYLKDFYNLYKGHQYTNDELITSFDVVDKYSTNEYLNQVRRCPVIARVQWLLSHSAVKETDPEGNDVFYKALVICPVVTLWNPYNTGITSSDWRIRPYELPMAFDFRIGNIADGFTHTDWVTYSQIIGTDGDTHLYIQQDSADDLYFRPGESKVFSPIGSPSNGGTVIHLKLGYRHSGGWRFKNLQPDGDPIAVAAGDTLSAAIKPSDMVSDPKLMLDGDLKNGSTWDWVWAPRMKFDKTRLTSLVDGFQHEDTRTLSIPSDSLEAEAFLNNLAGNPEIYASINYQVKTAHNSKFPSLGTVQKNPIQAHVELNIAAHPVNSTYDLMIYDHSDWTDTLLPNITPDANGYVASGFTASTGVPFAVLFELPVKPMQSLIELQHVDFQGMRSVPPFTTHALGNSMASPIMAPDAKANDVSYLLNDIFFDRYFCSSIAPRAPNWQWASGDFTSIEDVYKQHIEGEKPLPNARYKPYGNPKPSDVTASDAYASIAAKLQVDGLFNVNSTSQEAWLALLASMSQDKQLFYNPYDDAVVIQKATFPSEKFVVSRFSIPAGNSADDDDPTIGEIPEELYWRGYRTLSTVQLQALAASIVEQVQKRGPFLSLSEFINRQLQTSSSELSRQGAIQQAIETCSEDLNAVLKQNTSSKEITTSLLTQQNLNYTHPEAALGHSAHGAPGWITQADLLRPLAPYLTVRDDTFRIIGYGEVRDAKGQILTRAQCEAIVQRHPEYMLHTMEDDDDAANGNAPTESLYLPDGITPDASFDSGSINGQFGRRLIIKSFRWLSPTEMTANKS